MSLAENTIANRTLLHIDARCAGIADIRTAGVARLSGRVLGVLIALAALDIHKFHRLHLLFFRLGLTPHSRVGNDLPKLQGRLVGAKEGHHGCRLLLVQLDRMNLEACVHEALHVATGAEPRTTTLEWGWQYCWPKNSARYGGFWQELTTAPSHVLMSVRWPGPITML